MQSLYYSLVKKIEHHYKIDAHYFLRGGFWLTIGQVITLASGLATTALFAHFLTTNDYGTYKYLVGMATILASFSLTGLGQSILQTAAKKYYAFFKETFKLNFLYSLSISLISFVCSLYYWFNHNSLLALGCLMIAILQPIINAFQFVPSFLQGSGQLQAATKLHALRMFFITLLSLGSLLLTKDIRILFLVYLLSYAITNIASIFFYNYHSAPTPREVREKFILYAKHTSIRNLVSNVAQRADNIVIFTQLGATELAVYSIAMVIPEQIKSSFKNLATLLLPKYSKHEGLSVIKKSLLKRSVQLFSILLIISIIYILLSPLIFTLLFPKYMGAVLYTKILALSFPAIVALIPVSALQANLEEKKLYKLLIIESVISVVLLILLTFKFGLLGAIIAKVSTRYITSIFNFYYLYK